METEPALIEEEPSRIETEPPLITLSTEAEDGMPGLEDAVLEQTEADNGSCSKNGCATQPGCQTDVTESSSGHSVKAHVDDERTVFSDEGIAEIAMSSESTSDPLEMENERLRSELLKLQRELDEAKSEVRSLFNKFTKFLDS
jgi:hypothetical protein